MNKARAARGAIALVVAATAATTLLAALLIGSVDIAPLEALRALAGEGSELNRQIVRELRLPRVLSGFACGGLLALAGVLMQALLRNPLADPYILGVSSGASVGALTALSLGASAVAVNAAALAGALAVVGVLLWLAWRAAAWNVDRLLLLGVVLSAGLGAVVSLFLTLSPQAQLRGMLFWLIGDLARARDFWWPLSTLALIGALTTLSAVGLDVLSLGDVKAKTLGLDVSRFQVALFFCAALAATAAVTTGGAIGFVGLLAPHALRLAGVTQHRWLLPLAAVAGGTILVAADVVARSAVAPTQLPVGAVTALLGVPLLLLLLSKGLRAFP